MFYPVLSLTPPLDIASISAVEGKNWRHGDIEDVLKTVACIRHHKWNSMMIKRVYFGYAFHQCHREQELIWRPETGSEITPRQWTPAH